jgi:hypothetical protein
MDDFAPTSGCNPGEGALETPQRTDQVAWSGYSNFLPSQSAVSPAALWYAGGYGNWVDTEWELRGDPRLSNGTTVRTVYSMMHGMQPTYGQQYPDRHPTGLNERNSRDYLRTRMGTYQRPESTFPAN